LSYGDHISQEDLALYAMRALPPAETAEAQRHLDTCAECRGKLADTFGDLSLIAMSVPQEPLPAGARDRFLKRLHTEAVPAPAPAKSAPIPFVKPTEPQLAPARSGGWFTGLGWAAAAASLLFAAYMANNAHNLQQQLSAQRYQTIKLSGQASRAQQILDVLNSRTAKRVTLTEVKAAELKPTAHVIYEQKKAALIFEASNLTPVPANKTYELWLIPANGQAPIPAGLFRPDVNGSASVILPPLPNDVEAKAFGVTVEDAQGATKPTPPILLSGQ
jgi:anti-sigma-K factor RskA